MIKHATTVKAIGFLLFILGIQTFFLNINGVDIFIFAWLYEFNVALSFIIRILCVLIGLILIYVASTNWDVEEADY